MGVKILSFIVLGIIPILIAIATQNDKIVYIFGVLLFLFLGLIKTYLDRNPNSLLTNQTLSIIMVFALYTLGSVLLIGISQIWL